MYLLERILQPIEMDVHVGSSNATAEIAECR